MRGQLHDRPMSSVSADAADEYEEKGSNICIGVGANTRASDAKEEEDELTKIELQHSCGEVRKAPCLTPLLADDDDDESAPIRRNKETCCRLFSRAARYTTTIMTKIMTMLCIRAAAAA